MNKKYNIDINGIDVIELANIIDHPIHVITPDGTVQFVNKAWVSVYGVDLEDAVGKHIKDVVEISNFYLELDKSPLSSLSNTNYAMLDKPTDQSAAIIAANEKRPVTMLSQTPANNQVLVASTPFFDDEGEVTYVVTIIQDLTMLSSWHSYLKELHEENELTQKELLYLRANLNDSSLLGSSKSMSELRKLISIVAPSDATVLIYGESGTGKEVASKEIHFRSERAEKPFITVNCAAIPENLMESELFGHEKGAFTGAISSKAGLFEMANHGTILLDEIGEFPISLQPKLLRVLQEREIRHVGGTKTIPIDVRVIAATNRDLHQMVKDGLFRSDLFYRLNVFPITILPLRDRPEDIPALASSFLVKFNKKYNKSKFFTPSSIIALEHYPWPGNARELENTIERLVIISNEPAITADDVNYIMNAGFSGVAANVNSFGYVDLKTAVENLEKEMIQAAYSEFKSSYKVAEVLGTSQSTIARKMKQYEIE